MELDNIPPAAKAMIKLILDYHKKQGKKCEPCESCQPPPETPESSSSPSSPAPEE